MMSMYIRRTAQTILCIPSPKATRLWKINYMLGTAWMAYLTNTTFLQSLPMGALVFLPLDIVKIIIACLLGNRIRAYLHM